MTKRILVVEDEAPIRNLLTEIFSEEGHQVFAATNGQQALEQLSLVQVDLITLDIKMPVMDGHTFLAKLVELNNITPVVIISATYTTGLTHPLVQAELAKPFTIDRLLEVVNPYLQ